MTSVLHRPDEICEAFKTTVAQPNCRIAAPYWSVSAIQRIGLSGRRSDLRVLCNLSDGLCDPGAIHSLLDHGVSTRSLSTLHAKVLIGDVIAVVGSANVTLSALSTGRYEVCVAITDQDEIQALGAWFDKLWMRSADLTVPSVRAHLMLLATQRWVRKSRR